MNRQIVGPRLYIEILCCIAAIELLMMLVIPHLLPNGTMLHSALVDTVTLLILVGPFVCWRISSFNRKLTDTMRRQETDLKRLALVAERTSNAVVVTDAKARIIWVNEGFTRITGYTLEECKGRVPGHFLQCERTEPVAVQKLREAVRSGSGCRVQVLNRGKTGREYYLDIELQPIRDERGRLSGFMAIESDVTERERAREDLAAERDRAEAALREATALHTAFDRHAILSVADSKGRILEVNDTFCEISGDC